MTTGVDAVPQRRGLTTLALRNAAGSVLERGAGLLSGIILTPFILGHLGRDLYGVMTATSAAFDYLLLLRGGLGAAMRRHVTIRVHTGRIEEARRHYQAGFWWGLILRAPILIAGLLLATPLCRFVHLPENLIPDASRGVAILIVAAFLADTGVIFEVPRYAVGDTASISAVQAFGPILRIGLVYAAFTLFTPSLTLYTQIILALQCLLLLALAYLAQRTRVVGPAFPPPGLGDRDIRRELFGYGGLAVLGQAASLLYVTTDNLLIGGIYGTAAVTYYSLGARWMPLARGFLGSLVRPLAPLFTQLEATEDDARTRAVVLRTIALTAALAVPACLVPCVVGDLFLESWVGAEYRGAAAFLIVSLIPSVLDISFSPVWTLMVGRGRIGWVVFGDMIVSLANVAVSLILAVPLGLGLIGFALGNAFALVTKNLVLGALIVRRERSLPPMRLSLWQIAKAVVGGAPALVALYLARGAIGGSLLTLIPAGTVAAVFCLAGSLFVAVGWRELALLAKRAGLRNES